MSSGKIARYYPVVDITGLDVDEKYAKLLIAYLATDKQRFQTLQEHNLEIRSAEVFYFTKSTIELAWRESGHVLPCSETTFILRTAHMLALQYATDGVPLKEVN